MALGFSIAQFEMLIFVEGGRPKNPGKKPWSKDWNQQQIQPTFDAGSGNRTRLVGGDKCRTNDVYTPISFFGFNPGVEALLQLLLLNIVISILI